MKRVAILGGTFDPVHLGHLAIAEAALKQLDLALVIWVPVRLPPHKQGLVYEHRRSMVEKAIADNRAFVLEEVQTQGSQPDYAITTLTYLQKIYPKFHWYWILGVDAFTSLPRWYRCSSIAPACEWLVAPRWIEVDNSTARKPEKKGIDAQSRLLCQQVASQLAARNIPIRWQLLPMPTIRVSSSLIRLYCRQGHSISNLVPEAVRVYISTHNLYLD